LSAAGGVALDSVRPESSSSTQDERVLRQAFARGLIANLLNPKAAVFYVAILPTFIVDGRAAPLAQALLLGSTHLIISVIVHGAIVLTAANATAYVSSSPQRVIVRRVFGVAIAAIAVWLAFTTQWSP
jgi:threonine/homoserine/homoserine lactone efflux protein